MSERVALIVSLFLNKSNLLLWKKDFLKQIPPTKSHRVSLETRWLTMLFSCRSIIPVMPDVLDVVIVLHQVDELLHVLDVGLIGEGDVVLGKSGSKRPKVLIPSTF